MDPPISEASSGMKRPSLSSKMSSNTTKRARLELPLDQLTTVNNKMVLYNKMWSKDALSDPQIMIRVLSLILADLTDKLSTTNAKTSTFSALTVGEAKAIVDSFNEDELCEWEAGLQEGLEQNNWHKLIAHCTCQLPFKRQFGCNRNDSKTLLCYDQNQEPASGSTVTNIFHLHFFFHT